MRQLDKSLNRFRRKQIPHKTDRQRDRQIDRQTETQEATTPLFPPSQKTVQLKGKSRASLEN